jgi:hypothetical protein
MNFKNGASYVLSAIILTMIMFAVAGGLYYWSNSLQLEQQGTAEQSQERLSDALGACISVTSISYDTLTNTSDVIFRNCGNSNLNVGDDKIKDIGVLQAPGIDPCSFNLNETTCIGCPLKLEPGSSRLIVLNWSREVPCTERVTKGVKHQIAFYIDRLSTTSGVFTAEDVVSATTRSALGGAGSASCGVSLVNTTPLKPTAFAFLPGVTRSYCFNFTVTNTGSQQDTFALFNTTVAGSATACKGAFLIDGSVLGVNAQCNGAIGVIRASNVATDTILTLDAGATSIILINVTMADPAVVGYCFTNFKVLSNNCNSQYAEAQFNMSVT